MNKNSIQKYAVWARNELIKQVKQRAYQYGISDKGYGDENAAVISGRVLSADEKLQRQAFVGEIKKNGYQQAVEEVAYTWFNRFVALRFMEVNDYLPTHVRVFSDSNGGFNPEILKDVLHLDLPGLDKAKVYELLNANRTEELYRYLLLTQCNALNAALPEMFEKLGSYTEMLLPNKILGQDSVLARLVKDIPEDDWRDAVQMIGWMYQYYNTEPKQAVFDGLKKNVKISKEKIPAATQLFTPDWIVRYMVENSLGRLWLESHPNDSLKANWKYYLDEAERLRVLRSQSPVKSPEDIRLIDPCMGSGHILVYAFDVLMQIYESEGYNPRDAAKLILEKNLFGLDIDRRAYQLAYFSLMMKARQYNRRIFTEEVKPQVYYPAGYPDGEEYGSLVKVDALPPKPEEPEEITLFDDYERDLRVWNFKRLLAQKYDVVVTNPPYMGGKGQSGTLSEFLKNNYPDTKSDTFSAFIECCGQMTKRGGYIGMFTPYVWMFIQSYEELRNMLYTTKDIITLIQFEYSAFEEATVPVCTFVVRNGKTGATGEYLRLVDYRGGMEVQRVKTLEAIADSKCDYRYTTSTENFEKIPGCPVAYWVGDKILSAFDVGLPIRSLMELKAGMSTGNNDLFQRYWYEVNYKNIGFGYENLETANDSGLTWFPCNSGGNYRKWSCANEIVVFWHESGQRIRTYRNQNGKIGSAIRNQEYYFKEGLTWNKISSSCFGVRYKGKGFIFDDTSRSAFPLQRELTYYLLGLLTSVVTFEILKCLSPTLSFTNNEIERIPVLIDSTQKEKVKRLVTANICLSRADWDAFETSWDFKCHPLVHRVHSAKNSLEINILADEMLEGAFQAWEREAAERFDTLKANEEELNRIFIDIYGLQDELTPEIEDKDVTVRRFFDSKDSIPESMRGSSYALTKADAIKSLISYAVGCMFGRYSLDVEGLAYAGGEWDASKYTSFIPDKDNILPICDDEYFDDDIVGRFVDFVRVVYGEEWLENNLYFIAEALYPNGNGTAREKIRRYFLNDFYKDHCKIYKKRPIYWLFDSGKKNGFKALVYLHRYSRDLLAKLRTDYVHEQQERYRTQLMHVATALNTATGAERARLLKQQDKLTEQAREIGAYEEKVHHLADQNIVLDLDDGVKKNYEIFADVLAKI